MPLLAILSRSARFPVAVPLWVLICSDLCSGAARQLEAREGGSQVIVAICEKDETEGAEDDATPYGKSRNSFRGWGISSACGSAPTIFPWAGRWRN